jgi:predicted unusual protein kinase regulating ubiquinone biosynthesis (AarF/ABC1/UbiB family)
MTTQPPPDVPFDRQRYWRVVRYFAGVLVHSVWWEILLRRVLGRRIVERSFSRRWQRIARRFRLLAVELGGVLIKLGQFLSTRVDVLPREVTAELAGLQDEVPAETLADIESVIVSEFSLPMDQVFAWFSPEPDAAASLAQVHRARLTTGEEAVVKVQRPRIEEIVETDLRAVYTAMRWLKRYRPVSRRVDLDRLFDEFSRTTRRELDFVAEGESARRFMSNFADNPRISVPRVYAENSTRCVLVMENVASIKISDYEAIESAGISREEVAQCLFQTYLDQVFVHNFVHADPHPGNLFVQPLTLASDWTGRGKPFRLVFVDFGMVATIPERMRHFLTDFLVGFVTRDARRIVRAYQGAGVLLPGADLARLEQMEGELLERYAGLTFKQAQELAMDEWQDLASEYRDILYEMPFQLPTDLLFVGRAVALLFFMATALDPDLDPWQAIEPFARTLTRQEVVPGWQGLVDELQRLARITLSLPGQADRFLGKAARGELAVRTTWGPEATRPLRRVEVALNRLASAVIFAALLLAAVAVYVTQGGGAVSYLLFSLAGIALLTTLFRRS